MNNKFSDLSVVLCGSAGQGIQTIEHALTAILKQTGYYVFSTKEFMSRIRGGINSTQIRISNEPVGAYINRTDVCIPLIKGALEHLNTRLSEKTMILGEAEKYDTRHAVIDFSIHQMASEAGGKIYSNSVAVGAILGMLQVDPENYHTYFKKRFASKSEEIVQNNIKACELGYTFGQSLELPDDFFKGMDSKDAVKDEILMDGAEAIALGAIAGGCNFVCSYPMSPSTAVLVNAAKYAHDFGIAVEQVEDEIAAVNMGLGAWYAGARALVTTSGGGFALMEEGISLAGIIETPIVVHLAQRPGPATGLPTRTEQGDLNLVLYSGHGEFPRMILTPGNMEEAFSLAHKAFYFADKFQIPVFILTDQFLMDSSMLVRDLDLEGVDSSRFIVETDKDYLRFKLTEDGVSPRGIPGHGKGLVCVDSDEHTESGHITEDFDVRIQMVDKRLKKMASIVEESVPPALIGDNDYETLVVCWGSTLNPVTEALSQLADPKLAMLHFSQVYPIAPQVGELLDKAKQVVVVESNATGQFAQLLSHETGVQIHDKLLKYNGLPFSVEDVVEGLGSVR